MEIFNKITTLEIILICIIIFMICIYKFIIYNNYKTEEELIKEKIKLAILNGMIIGQIKTKNIIIKKELPFTNEELEDIIIKEYFKITNKYDIHNKS